MYRCKFFMAQRHNNVTSTRPRVLTATGAIAGADAARCVGCTIFLDSRLA